MNITQEAREAAAPYANCLKDMQDILEGKADALPVVQVIAAAEARGFERAREMAAKCADDELVEIFDDSPEIDMVCNSVVREIAAAIRAMDDL